MKTRAFTLVVGTMLYLIWATGNSLAQGANVILARSTGELVEGELLVASDSLVILRTDSSSRNIWWQGDSAFAVLVPLAGVRKITMAGNSGILVGTVTGALLGAGIGAATAQGGWIGASAGGGGLLGVLAGLVVGAIAQRSEKVFDREGPDGFQELREYARFGATTPAILKHL